jgi:hypothetical protein
MALGLDETRWLMFEQGTGAVSKPMLMILVFWLMHELWSFPTGKATVTAALLVSGLSVSGAIFLILELYMPFSGLIQISSAPLRAALTHLGM